MFTAQKNTLKEIPNINPKYIKLFFFPFTIFFAFFPSFFFFLNFYLCKQCTWTRCIFFSALHRGRGIKKKYAIAQQMQMFKRETQRTMGMKQQTENFKTVKEKQIKQLKEKTEKIWNPVSFLSWVGVALRPEVYVTAAGRLPCRALHPIPRSWPCFRAGAWKLEEPASWVPFCDEGTIVRKFFESSLLSSRISFQQHSSLSQSPWVGN